MHHKIIADLYIHNTAAKELVWTIIVDCWAVVVMFNTSINTFSTLSFRIVNKQ